MKIQSVQSQQIQSRPAFSAVGFVKRPLPSRLFPANPSTNQLESMTLTRLDVKAILENLKASMGKVRSIKKGAVRRLILGREVIILTRGYIKDEKMLIPAKINIKQGENRTILSEEYDLDGSSKIPDELFDNVFNALRQKAGAKRVKK